MRARRPSGVFDAFVASIAVAKAVVALTALSTALAQGSASVVPKHFLRLAHVMSFGIAGMFLLLGGKRDERARPLGIGFLLIATTFADSLVRVHAADARTLDVAERMMALQVDAFLPFYLWRFVQAFPRALVAGKLRRLVEGAIVVSFCVGAVMLTANLLLAIFPDTLVSAAPWLLLLSPWPRTEFYWPAQFTLSAIALGTLVARSRQGSFEEQRRGKLLVAALVVGTGPSVAWMLLRAASADFAAFLPLRRAGWVIYPTLLSTPFTTAYAVLVRRALDVRLVVRMAIRYAMARYSILTLAAAPLVILLVALYHQRHQSVEELVSTPPRIGLLALAVAGMLVARSRGEVLRRIDRRFFREQYDSRRILGQLIERCRTAADTTQLAAVLRTEIDRALHLHDVHVLFRDRRTQSFVAADARVRPLDASWIVVEELVRSDGGLDVELEHPASLAERLPPAEVNWILDAGARFLFPLRDHNRQLLGVIALGDKRSELPLSREDRELLTGVATAAEMAVAYGNMQPESGAAVAAGADTSTGDRRAAECVQCGTVQPFGDVSCVRCQGETIESPIPQVVAGKFLVEQRIGAGGMGVVYRGMDLHLGRVVAIKTLPHLTAREAIRLQREARTIASFSHPNLALIFGTEVWQGQPLLVFEYLAGGTLADALRKGPLELSGAIRLGLEMASVLDAIHQAAVLHLDIKPSNIGFTGNGTPKLLDFGLAHLMTSVASDRQVRSSQAEAAPLFAETARVARRRSGLPEVLLDSRTEGEIRGTRGYTSPAAAVGKRPDPSFDLWSLSVVLHEAIFGRSPFSEYAGAPAPDLSLAPAVADFFFHALSERVEDRPASAQEFAERLRRVDPSTYD